MDKSHYIAIRPPYTVDLWKDESSQTRNANEMQSLENYIPIDGGLYAREGITALAHTAQTT